MELKAESAHPDDTSAAQLDESDLLTCARERVRRRIQAFIDAILDETEGPHRLVRDHLWPALVDFQSLDTERYWEHWIDKQAHFLWVYKGSPQNQDANGVRDDRMNAKRYLAYLLAENARYDCLRCKTEGASGAVQCPLTHLSPARIRHLISLSVHQYLCTMAYFRYVDRQRRSSPEQEKEDYFVALGDLGRAFDSSCGPEGMPALVRIREDRGPVSRAEVKAAKKNVFSLLSLDPGRHSELSRKAAEYVDEFYDWFESDCSAPSQSLMENLDDTHIVNMFELMMRCYLLHSLASANKQANRTAAP